MSFSPQTVAFPPLVTRIPAIQDRYGVSDALLPAFLAAVPILAGVGANMLAACIVAVASRASLPIPAIVR